MKEKYIEIVNNMTNYYKESVKLFTKEEKNKVITITLVNFATLKLTLKNINREKIYYDSENYNAIENRPVQISKIVTRYLVASIGEYKGEYVVFTYECEDIDFNLELYDYSDMNIAKNNIKDDYRVKLGNMIAHNLLMKHATLGDEFLNEKEKNMLSVAMWIAIMDSSQSFIQTPGYNKIYDLFIQYNGKYEKEEFLSKAIEVEENYKSVEEVNKVCKLMTDCLDKLQTSKDRGVYSKMEEKLIDHLCFWNNLEPVYKIYVDFTNYMKDACKDFKVNKPVINVEIEDYIKEKIGKKLLKAGFEEEYPFYRIKTENKVYVLEFEIINSEKIIVKMLQEILNESDELTELLNMMDYKYLKPQDINGWSQEICKNKEEIDEEVDTILDCLLVDKTLFKQSGKLRLIGALIVTLISYILWKPPVLVCGVIGIITYIILSTIEKYGRIFLAIWNEGENENENE